MSSGGLACPGDSQPIFILVIYLNPQLLAQKPCAGFQEHAAPIKGKATPPETVTSEPAGMISSQETQEKGPKRTHMMVKRCRAASFPAGRGKRTTCSLLFQMRPSTSDSQTCDPFGTPTRVLRKPQTQSLPPFQTVASPQPGSQQPKGGDDPQPPSSPDRPPQQRGSKASHSSGPCSAPPDRSWPPRVRDKAPSPAPPCSTPPAASLLAHAP